MSQQEQNAQSGTAQDEQARELLARAREMMARNDAAGGLALLKSVVPLACAPSAKIEAAKLLAAAGANVEAIACYLQAGKAFLFDHTDVLKARQALAAAHALDPNDLDVIFQMGQADVTEGHTQDGLAKFIDILRRSNLKHTPALFEAGCIYQKNSQLDQAILAFKKVLDRDKDHVQAMVHMGQLYQTKGLKTEALAYFINAAESSREHGDSDGARQLASAVLAIDEGSAKARFILDELDKQKPPAPAAPPSPVASAKPAPPPAPKPAPPKQAVPEPPGAPVAPPPKEASASKAPVADPEREAAWVSLKQVEARRQAAQENLRSLLASSEELERMLGEQRAVLETAMARKSELDREIAERKASLESTQVSLTEAEQSRAAVSKVDAERAAAEKALVDLRAEHEALAERHTAERAALESVIAKHEEMAAEQVVFAHEFEELEAKVRAAQSAQATAETARGQSEAAREQAEAAREQAEAARRQAEQAKATAEAELAQALAAQADVAGRRSKIDEELAGYQALRKTAQDEAADAEAVLSELEGRIETAQVEVERRQQQLRAMLSQIELAQAKATEEAAKVNEALSAAEQAEALRAKRSAEAEALAQRLAILEASIQESLVRDKPASSRRANLPPLLPPLPREEPEGFAPLARADAWAAAGDWGRAASAYRQVLDENPDDAGACYHLACILADHFEDFENAEKLLATAARLRPDHTATQYRAAMVMAQTGRVEQGAQQLLALVRHDEANAEFIDQFVERFENNASRGDPQAMFRLGIAYRELGRIEEALVAFQAIQREPEYVVQCLIAIGLCLRRQGLDGAAAKRFSKALETPGYPEAQYHEALYHLADLYEAKGTTESLRLALSSLEELYSSDISYLDVADRIRAVKAKLEAGDSPKVTRLPTRHAEPGDR